MADNQINGVLGNKRLTATLQTVYTASATGVGKQVAGTLQITSLDKVNARYFDVVINDGTDDYYYNEHHPINRAQTELRPISLKDGQSVSVRMDSFPMAMTISAATQANPVVLTVDDTSTLANDDWVEISGVVGMTELNGNRYKCTKLSATTISLQDLSGSDINGTGFTAYTSGGNAQKSIGDALFIAYEETIPQEA